MSRRRRRSYDDFTTAPKPPGGTSLLESEDGLTYNQRSRGRPGSFFGLGCFAERLSVHLSAIYTLWFIAFVIACSAMSQANKNKSKISSSSSSSSPSPSFESSLDDFWYNRCRNAGDLLYGTDIIEYKGHHYQILGGNWAQITWHSAQQDAWYRCYKGSPGYLASINSADENEYLAQHLRDNDGFVQGDSAWIGGNDMTNEGSFEWVDGYAAMTIFSGPGSNPDTYSNWMTGEPNSNGDEDCVTINSEGLWNDNNCYKGLAFFIVEYDV